MSRQNRRSDHVARGTFSFDTLGQDARAALEQFEQDLRTWAPKLDLIAPGDLSRLRDRHIADSLKALPLVDSLSDGPAVDVGSGAGLPGIPLAIAGRPRVWRLLEPRKRRAAFLEEVVRVLDLEAEVVPLTAEEAARDPLFRDHAVAVARALAPPAEADRIMNPLLRAGGTAILWVGKGAELPPGSVLSTEGLVTIEKG